MNKQFCDYETAKKLKELGLKEKCFGFYANKGKVHNICDNNWHSHRKIGEKIPVTSPLWQQIEEWLWEEHKIYIGLSRGLDDFWMVKYVDKTFDSPITAKIEGIKAAVKYLTKT